MKTILCLLSMLAFTICVTAQQPVNINFNLVQVNHFNKPDSTNTAAPVSGQRFVIDLGNPVATAVFSAGGSRIDISPAAVQIIQLSPAGTHTKGQTLNWETSMILRSPAGDDSFLVTASKIGCPGTEVKPSVSVSFATGKGWSDPPIRFGPLAPMTVCPLGRGFQLEVNACAEEPPLVSLKSEATLVGKR